MTSNVVNGSIDTESSDLWGFDKVLKVPSPNFIIKRKKSSLVAGKATGCHFPLNSTKHMGTGLHSSQIVKIFFKKPKSSRDGSKCVWFS